MRRLSPALSLVVACGGRPVVPAPADAGTAMTDPQSRGGPAINGNPGGEQGAGSPAPKSATRTSPEPPSQGAPWTRPATKLSRSLVEATVLLFIEVLPSADPPNCVTAGGLPPQIMSLGHVVTSWHAQSSLFGMGLSENPDRFL